MTNERTVLVALALALTVSNAVAQELEPGAYQNTPIGVNVFIVGYGYSTGNVLVDAALPVEGAKAQIHGLAVGYLRTIDVFGHAGKFDVILPLSSAHFEGVIAGEFRTRDPKGLADPRVRLSVNFLGSPALDLPEFVRYRQRTILGASVQVTVPIGQYDGERLVNLGANRWAFRPELGISQAYGRWVFEGGAGVWLFTDNDEYFGESTLSQRPLYFAKGNAICSFRRNLWASFSYGHATGGETELDGLFRNDLQKNDRIAATLALPAGRIGAVRFVFTSGLTTRLGADFDSITVTYQYSWGPKPARK